MALTETHQMQNKSKSGSSERVAPANIDALALYIPDAGASLVLTSYYKPETAELNLTEIRTGLVM